MNFSPNIYIDYTIRSLQLRPGYDLTSAREYFGEHYFDFLTIYEDMKRVKEDSERLKEAQSFNELAKRCQSIIDDRNAMYAHIQEEVAKQINEFAESQTLASTRTEVIYTTPRGQKWSIAWQSNEPSVVFDENGEEIVEDIQTKIGAKLAPYAWTDVDWYNGNMVEYNKANIVSMIEQIFSKDIMQTKEEIYTAKAMAAMILFDEF